MARTSVHLDVHVNVPNELETRVVADRAEHQKEYVTSGQCVAEELQCLQTTRHVASFHIEKYCVAEYEETCGSCRDHRAPPPSVVLGRQLEIGQRDRNARGHAQQYEKD